jgi:hypothetical protein
MAEQPGPNVWEPASLTAPSDPVEASEPMVDGADGLGALSAAAWLSESLPPQAVRLSDSASVAARPVARRVVFFMAVPSG